MRCHDKALSGSLQGDETKGLAGVKGAFGDLDLTGPADAISNTDSSGTSHKECHKTTQPAPSCEDSHSAAGTFIRKVETSTEDMNGFSVESEAKSGDVNDAMRTNVQFMERTHEELRAAQDSAMENHDDLQKQIDRSAARREGSGAG